MAVKGVQEIHTDDDRSPAQAGFVYLWEYRVPPEATAAFEQLYGPEGAWAQLFRRHPGYLGTLLLADPERPGRYLTVDRWRSRQDRDDLRRLHAAEWDDLDRRGDRLTTRETPLGELTPVT